LCELLLQGADWLTGSFMHLQCPDDSTKVVGMELGGGRGIDFCQAAMQRRGAFDAGGFLKFAAQFPIRRRAAEEAAEECFQIQRRAADKEDLAATGDDLIGGCRGGFEVLSYAEILRRVENVDQMMRDALLLLSGWLRSADVHTTIQSHGIERDDFGADLLRQLNADCRFAARRWAGDKPGVADNGSLVGHSISR
jgi:hypothetical protein